MRLRRHTGGPDAAFRARHFSRLRGEGLEIGPLHSPATLHPSCTVRYVDKFPLDELRRRNPDVPADAIVAPDLVSDSHRLDGVPDGSVDFIVASHVFEHLHNPLAALLEWHRVLRRGGVLACIVPDGRFTFDKGRPLTCLDHLLWDFANDGTQLKRLSDLAHIAECNLNMHEHLNVESALELAWAILRETYDTHFHVWSYHTLREQLERLVGGHKLPFAIVEAASDRGFEMAFLLEAKRQPSRLDVAGVPSAAR